MKKFIILLLLGASLISFATSSYAGKIVLANDEWTLSNTGFYYSNDTGTYANNVAEWFSGSATGGNFLAYSSNFGLTQSSLNTTMNANHTWSVSTGVDFTVTNLLNYDGIFLSGTYANNQVLIDYVDAGGNVYLAGGTGWGGAASEAAQWNTFLNEFGLGFGTYYNGITGNIKIVSDHTIFDGVNSLYQNNGNSTLDINVTDPLATLLVSQGDQGLYAVYDSDTMAPVPEPATMFLLGLGLVGMVSVRRRRK